MTELRETAYGKLNLSLDILGRRPDGYHELEMVMCSVDLRDELRIRLGTGADWEVRCDRGEIPQGEGNLCYKAARRFFDAAGLDPDGLCIEIQKNIPAQAGMAGGSSDAAAVLRALNRHYGCFSGEALRRIGLQVGSDVPYCLFGGLALARGRGEELERLPPLPEEAVFVLVKPDFSVSTPALFAEIDAVGVQERPDTGAMLRAIRDGDLRAVGAQLKNAFEPPVSAARPVVQELRAALLRAGALGAKLTGTGSVVFGLFDSIRPAAAAALELQRQVPEVHVVQAVRNEDS